MILYMYIALGQGLTIPWWRKFDVNRNILSFRSFVASFKKLSLKSDFIQFFSCFIHVYSSGAGADSPQGQNFDVNRNVSSLHSFVASFKKMSFKSDFIQFFHDLIHVHVYSPGAEADSPRGQNFDVNRKALSLYPFVASFKEISLKSDFIQFFLWFNTCISPWGRGRQPPGDKIFMSTECLLFLMREQFLWCKPRIFRQSFRNKQDRLTDSGKLSSGLVKMSWNFLIT